jgi:hypothetical protein
MHRLISGPKCWKGESRRWRPEGRNEPLTNKIVGRTFDHWGREILVFTFQNVSARLVSWGHLLWKHFKMFLLGWFPMVTFKRIYCHRQYKFATLESLKCVQTRIPEVYSVNTHMHFWALKWKKVHVKKDTNSFTYYSYLGKFRGQYYDHYLSVIFSLIFGGKMAFLTTDQCCASIRFIKTM